MNDQMIISLLYERSEKAIQELGNKYGKNCKAIAFRVLQNEQDAEECVNDACLAVWNTRHKSLPYCLPIFTKSPEICLSTDITSIQQKRETITMM